jgi:hypothetical protein
MVEASAAKQLLVISLLNDRAVLDHENGVGILNGGEAVRNDKAGLIAHELGHCGLDADLGARVDV